MINVKKIKEDMDRFFESKEVLEDEERLTNFAYTIKNINEDIDRFFESKEMLNKDFSICLRYGIRCYSREMKMAISDTPLALIYDYQKCNPYARVIMRITQFSFTMSKRWKGKYYDMFKGAEKNVATSEKFVYLCRAENILEKYTFIFWALLILTVDKTDAEKHLSLICDYAKMLNITADEFEDIIHIVKIIYNQDKPQDFKSETIPKAFEQLFTSDKEGKSPLKVVDIGEYSGNYLHSDKTIFKSMLPPGGMVSAKKNYDKARKALKGLNYEVDQDLVPNSNLFLEVK